MLYPLRIFLSLYVTMSGSRYDSKNILLVGGMSVLLVVAIVSIGCAVIIMIKKQKSKTGRKLVVLIHF